jgi:acetylornithine deacetylase/succinyl-diaminopimelate desuccinylase-like protein
MKLGLRSRLAVVIVGSTLLASSALAQSAPTVADSALAREIYEELVEIPSVSGSAETTRATRAMAQRLLDAGFPAADVHVVGPDTAGTLVAIYRGTGAARPILLLAHLDVVPALRADWSYDPFVLTEEDGWWYARGSSDNKAGAAALIINFVRLKREGFVPNRDLIVALTGDEETSSASIRWLVGAEGRVLIDDPAFALNTDAGEGALVGGRERSFNIQASEKIYLSFRLEVTNPGGHSSRPRPDNAIYQLVAGLERLARHRFPIALNDVTRGFFARQAELDGGADAADLRAVSEGDVEAGERLAASSPYYNALLRTTCVATRLEAGHADNALPQSARAIVNCRILPTETADAVEGTLREVLADSAIAVARVREPTPSPPSPLVPEVLGPIEALVAEFWPGVPIVPTMETGATDGLYVRNAGIPVYGVGAIFDDPDDSRAHGRDERVAIERFYEALEFWYRMVRAFYS